MSTPKPTKLAEKPPPVKLPPIAPPRESLPDPQDGDGDNTISNDPVADEIMAQVQQGNDERFGELFHSYQQRLCAVISSSCPKGVDAEDIAQETWLRVFRCAKQYRVGTNFGAWLFKVGINIARDKHRRRNGEVLGDEEFFTSLESNAEKPGETLEQLLEVYKSCLIELTEDAQRVVRGRTSINTNDDVAKFMGMKPPRTAEIYQRALAQLLECIRGKLS